MSNITHIRKRVFRVNQADFTAIAGVTQPTVSRWESGSGEFLTLEQMARIRAAAADRNIKWKDTWFFEVPAPTPKESA